VLRTLIHNWWLLALRGVFALLFALLAFSLREAAFSWLLGAIASASVVVLFGLFAFTAGLFTLGAGMRGPVHGRERWLLLLDGLGASICGVVVAVLPDLSLFHLIYVMAWWAVFVGTVEFVIALHLRRHMKDEWLLAVFSIASILFGAGLLLSKVATELAVLSWIALYSGFSGVTILVLAFRLRSLQLQAHKAAAAALTSE